MYDYLIVGSGLYGSVCAYELHKRGYKVLVIDKRNHIGGNIYTKNIEGINVHIYGAHIFHTSNKEVWEYINSFAKFNNFINSPIANYKGELYNLPFNMNTFTQLWEDVKTSEDAKRKIEEEKKQFAFKKITNLEEQAISLVGNTIYQKLIKGYTEKQWGKDCKELPSFIIRRLPVRFTFDNNYFNDIYQGIPEGGYTQIIAKMLDGIEVRLNCKYDKKKHYNLARKIIYTGPIDQYFDYQYGCLEYRSVRFENEILDMDDFQGNAVINYTDKETPYTRIIEHKHFEKQNNINKTIISKEYSSLWTINDEPYYPLNDNKNTELLNKYIKEIEKEEKVCFGGRLGLYQYLDMDKVIEKALNFIKEEVK